MINVTKKETYDEKVGAIKFIERQDIFVNQLCFIFLLKTWKLAHWESLYAIHMKYVILTRHGQDICKDVSFLPLRAIL